jgi:hypothetical protein
MGLKTDTSFLRFLTMGALGVRQTIRQLRADGFEPIELERYCGSNKLWRTKVKRLRLPDLLCVRTGLRLEVRAKSDLKIRMSDAPNNPERRWDTGLRDDDVTAFISVLENEEGEQIAAEKAIFFTVASLRNSSDKSRLGPPKSASEGAEQDREWPAIIPSCNGKVTAVGAGKLTVEMISAANERRKQTYTLREKNSYVGVGDAFSARVSILAGAPGEIADMGKARIRAYAPLDALNSVSHVDRYAAVKALPFRDDLGVQRIAALEALLPGEQEQRVALEIAGAAAKLGSNLGRAYLIDLARVCDRKDFRLEAVLILTELGDNFARDELTRIASDGNLDGDELRQAAVWGLGKAGLKAYERIVPLIGSNDENLALHAIAAFGADTPEATIRALVAELGSGDARMASGASEALRLIASETAMRILIEASAGGNDWVMATLGRFPAALVRPAIQGSQLGERLAPMLLLGSGANWLASEARVMDIAFLLKQNF